MYAHTQGHTYSRKTASPPIHRPNRHTNTDLYLDTHTHTHQYIHVRREEGSLYIICSQLIKNMTQNIQSTCAPHAHTHTHTHNVTRSTYVRTCLSVVCLLVCACVCVCVCVCVHPPSLCTHNFFHKATVYVHRTKQLNMGPYNTHTPAHTQRHTPHTSHTYTHTYLHTHTHILMHTQTHKVTC